MKARSAWAEARERVRQAGLTQGGVWHGNNPSRGYLLGAELLYDARSTGFANPQSCRLCGILFDADAGRAQRRAAGLPARGRLPLYCSDEHRLMASDPTRPDPVWRICEAEGCGVGFFDVSAHTSRPRRVCPAPWRRGVSPNDRSASPCAGQVGAARTDRYRERLPLLVAASVEAYHAAVNLGVVPPEGEASEDDPEWRAYWSIGAWLPLIRSRQGATRAVERVRRWAAHLDACADWQGRPRHRCAAAAFREPHKLARSIARAVHERREPLTFSAPALYREILGGEPRDAASVRDLWYLQGRGDERPREAGSLPPINRRPPRPRRGPRTEAWDLPFA